MFEKREKIESLRKQIKHIFKRTIGKSNYKTKNTIPPPPKNLTEWTQQQKKKCDRGMNQ